MERLKHKINNKLTNYIIKLKDDFKSKIAELEIEDEKETSLVQFLYNYERLVITKEDLQKKKRVKNVVSLFERCRGKRANGEQCTRRRKNNNHLCGTHIKGTPHGMVELSNKEADVTKVEIWTQDIRGIIYYIDDNNNVYNTKDIFENKTNPQIIGQYKINDTGEYKIVQ